MSTEQNKRRNLLAIIAEDLCVELKEVLSGHNAYWVPDWSPLNSNEKEKKRKGKILRCKPGLPSCKYEMLPEGQLLTLQPSTEWELWTKNKQQQNVIFTGAEDAHQKPPHCLCRRKARTLWPGNLLPRRALVFTFVLSPWRKARNSMYNERTISAQRNTEKERMSRLQCGLGAADCLARRGDGPWEVGRAFEESAVCLLPVHLLLPPLGIFSNMAPFRFLKC